MLVGYLSQGLLQPALFGDGEFTDGLPAALQLLHLLLQPVGVGRAAPGQVSHRALQGPDAPRPLAQLLLEHLQRGDERGVEGEERSYEEKRRRGRGEGWRRGSSGSRERFRR